MQIVNSVKLSETRTEGFDHKKVGPEVDIDDLGLCIEYLVTTLRALVRGHPSNSNMVMDPLRWGAAKLEEAAGEALKRAS